MDRNNIDDIAKAIAGLKLWKKASKYNWALVSELFDKPLIAAVNPAQQGPIAGRLLLFNGFSAHRDFMIFSQNPNLSFGMSPMDFDHYEVIGLKDGGAEVYDYRPGFLPVHPDEELRALLAPALYEAYGLLLRIDEDPELPAMYMGEKSLLSRREGLDGKWHDAPLRVPNLDTVTWTERVGLDRAKCTQAARFDMATDEVWEADLIQMPLYRTEEKQARILHLLAAVEVKHGERCVWQKLAVDPRLPRNGTSDALKLIWESLASHILDGIIRHGRVPGAIHVRSQRMMRFLRPLGLQLPFKIVLHEELPRLTASVNQSILDHTI